MKHLASLAVLALWAVSCPTATASEPPSTAPPEHPSTTAVLKPHKRPNVAPPAQHELVGPAISPDPLAPLFEPLHAVGDALARINLSIRAQYTFVLQQATDTIDDQQSSLLNGRFDLQADWTAFQNGQDSGSIVLLMRSGENIFSSQDFALGSAVGSINAINSLQGNSPQEPITLNLVYWQQSFFDKRLAVYVGKILPGEFMDSSFVADDETDQFLADPFDGNPVNPYEGAFTPGAAVEWQVSPQLYVNTIVADAQGSAGTGFETTFDGSYFEAVEIGWTPSLPSLGRSLYRFDLWHARDPDDSEGWGVQAGLDQEFTSGWTIFMRWGTADAAVTPVRRMVAGGIANTQPFGREGDMLGVGLSWSDPSDPALGDQTLLETFYRFQLTRSTQLSADIQLLCPPSDPRAQDVVAVFGLRAKITF